MGNRNHRALAVRSRMWRQTGNDQRKLDHQARSLKDKLQQTQAQIKEIEAELYRTASKLQSAQETEQQILAENRHRKELVDAIFDADPSGLAVLGGERLVHLFVNLTYRSMIPHPEVDPLGLPYIEVWPQHENFRGSWLLHRVMEAGSSFHFDLYPQPFPDGSTRFYSVAMRPLSWNGQRAVLLVMWDVTPLQEAQRQAEQAADEARWRAEEAEEGRRVLEALLDYLPEGIAIACTPGVTIQRISQYGKEMNRRLDDLTEDIPMNVQAEYWQFYHPDSAELARAEDLPLSRAILKGERIINEEWMLKKDNGEKLFVACTAGPILNSLSQISGGLMSWHNITDRKRVEAALENYALRLERSNNELQAFAFVASHDLQEPLRKIQAFGDRLKLHSQDKLDDQELDFLNRMQAAANRMSAMIQDLLTYSRVTTKAQPFESVDLREIIDNVLLDLELRLERTKGRIEVGPLPVIEADPLQMQLLFQNLINNALKFHRPGVPPVVRISGEVVPEPGSHNGRTAQITVEDNGIGFDTQYLDRIFQPFERLHGRSEYEGTGMGLAICHKVIQRHSGAIDATSKPGKGSKFHITLPLKQVLTELEAQP